MTPEFGNIGTPARGRKGYFTSVSAPLQPRFGKRAGVGLRGGITLADRMQHAVVLKIDHKIRIYPLADGGFPNRGALFHRGVDPPEDLPVADPDPDRI